MSRPAIPVLGVVIYVEAAIKIMQLPLAVVITLREAAERHKHLEQEFQRHGIAVARFYGVNAKKWGLQTALPYLDDTPNWQPEHGQPHFIPPESIGCIMSHWILWQILLRANQDEFLVFEDDVKLCENFKILLLQFMENLPKDWEFSFVGRGGNVSGKEVAPGIIKPNYPPFCTHAYLVKKSALPLLIQTNEMAWAPIDIQLQKKSLPHLKHYVAEPPLARQFDRAETH
jgi:GR25 family glycosyltransferase involved in LPS biosynthesis